MRLTQRHIDENGQRAKDGQSASAVPRELGMSMRTLRNWLEAAEPAQAAGRTNVPKRHLAPPRPNLMFTLDIT